MRIAVGGFQHETNTFAPAKATFDDFARGGGWPPLLKGDDVFDGTAGINLPVAGFVEAMRKTTHRLVPTAWAAASPSAHVTEDAYERISGMIVYALKSAGKLDAVYLDLHGAMVAEHANDGEGELLSRVRAVVGPDIPVVASLDLHANVTQRMLEHADVLIAYRTYPHVDMAETGARVAHFLQYFGLGVLVYLAMSGFDRKGTPWRVVAGVISFCAVWGGLDEWHQSFVPGRDSSLKDLAFDVAGATAAALFVRWIAWRNEAR